MKKAASTNDAPKALGLLSQAIITGDLIFVSGQIHIMPDNVLVIGTTEEKVARIMKNIHEILSAAGSAITDIVKATIYVTDMSQMPAINKVWPTYFTEPLPAREAICVAELPLNATIEISVVAEPTGRSKRK